MANPDWTDPLDFSAEDILAEKQQIERLAWSLITALTAAEQFIARTSGNGETGFRDKMRSVIADARQVLA